MLRNHSQTNGKNPVFDILRQKAWKLSQGFILVQESYILRDVEVHNF